MAESSKLETLQGRLRHWREKVVKLTLREVWEAVNTHLPEGESISLATVNNYEAPRHQPPRTSFLIALKKAFPDLNLEWLLFNTGEPRLSQEAAGHFVAHHVPVEMGGVEAPLPDLTGYGKRFPSLTGAATWVVVSFLNEVRASDQRYWSDDSQEWTALLRQIIRMVETPLTTPGPFVERNALSNSEVMTFALTMTAALRPLIPSLRPDRETPERESLSSMKKSRKKKRTTKQKG